MTSESNLDRLARSKATRAQQLDQAQEARVAQRNKVYHASQLAEWSDALVNKVFDTPIKAAGQPRTSLSLGDALDATQYISPGAPDAPMQLPLLEQLEVSAEQVNILVTKAAHAVLGGNEGAISAARIRLCSELGYYVSLLKLTTQLRETTGPVFSPEFGYAVTDTAKFDAAMALETAAKDIVGHMKALKNNVDKRAR